MTDKERLEELKQDVKMTRKDLVVSPSNEMTLHMGIMLDSMEFLIKQAERLQKSEEIKNNAIEQIDVTQERNERLENRVQELESQLKTEKKNHKKTRRYFNRYKNKTSENWRAQRATKNRNIQLESALDKRNVRVQELEDIIYQDARQEVLEGLYEENKRYREALQMLNRVAKADIEDSIGTNSQFVLDITADALKGDVG